MTVSGRILSGLCALAMVTVGATGCAPKRVVVTGPAVSQQLAAQQPAAQEQQAPSSSKKTSIVNKGDRAVELARAQLGKPYQWGASGPDKFDCSGLVQYVYKNLGVPLPRVSGAQASSGYHVDRQDLKPGDLVFFRLSGGPINHVGIYVGRGKFIHAPKKNNPVRLDNLNDSWWGQKFKGGRRVG